MLVPLKLSPKTEMNTASLHYEIDSQSILSFTDRESGKNTLTTLLKSGSKSIEEIKINSVFFQRVDE